MKTVLLKIWGVNALNEACRSANVRLQKLYAVDGKAASITSRAGCPIKTVDRKKLTEICGDPKNQGIAAEAELGVFESLREWAESNASSTKKGLLVLALDQIQDPHNLGSILRSAHFFGVSCVLLTKDRAAPINGTVAKTSSGALFSVPLVLATNLARELEWAAEAGYWRIGLDSGAEKPLSEVDYSEKRLLVIGNEGEGLRSLTRKRCDELARISFNGLRDSLNASVAGAIACFEIARNCAKN